MADEQHRIRIVLEALDRGSSSVRNFFQGIDKDTQKFRNTLRDTNKELDLTFGPAGVFAPGRFKALDQVELAIIKMRELREEASKTRKESALGQLFGGFQEGRSEAANIRKIFEDRVNLSKEAAQQEREVLERTRQDERRSLDRRHFEERQELEKNVILQEKIRIASDIRKLRDQANYYEDRIAAARRAAVREGLVVSEAAIEADRNEAIKIRGSILRIEQERDAKIKALREARSEEQKIERQQFDFETGQKKRSIKTPDVAQIFAQARAEMKAFDADIDRTDSRLSRFGRNAGKSLSDFRLGVALGRQELSEADRQFIRSESRLTRLGAAFGNATRGARQFVNVRWAVIIGFLQVFLTLVVQLGLALVALASSAIQAAGALGGALLAGITQLVPVVGLLAAAFSRLGAVLDAVKIAEKLELSKAEDETNRLDTIRQATQRLADARFAAVRAGEAIRDAEFELAEAGRDVLDAFKEQGRAFKDLEEARRDAARAIVDANLEERDAALSLEEAELALLDARKKLREEQQKGLDQTADLEQARANVREAKARLDQARAEGDQAEISTAAQELTLFEQNLQEVQNQIDTTRTTVKEAETDVRRAQLNKEEAQVRNKRAQTDAEETRRKGIQGAEQVISAQERLVAATRNIAQAQRREVLANRALRDAVIGLSVAKREEADAERELNSSRKEGTAQQKALQDAMADLSPAEKGLMRSIQRLKKVYADNFRPITDIIVRSFDRAVQKIIPLLSDPKILKAAKNLATSIAGSVDALSDFAVSPEFRRFLVFTLNQAAENVPKLTDSFINLFTVLMRIATAAAPLFNRLIDRFLEFTKQLEERTRNPESIEKFFRTAERHLDSWISFAGAVGRILGLIIKLSSPAGGGGGGLIDSLTDKLNEWSDWIEDNEDKVQDFFKNIQRTVEGLASTLGRVAVVLFKAFTSDEATALSQFILETMIPAFTSFLFVLGVVARILNTAFALPFIGDWIKWAVQLLIIYGLFVKLIPVSQKFFNLLRASMAFILSGKALVAMKGFIDSLKIFLLIAKSQGVMAAFAAVFPRLAAGIRLVGAALKFVFLTNPWIAVVVGIIAAIVLLDRKFHFIAPTIKFIGKLFRDIFNWVKENWKKLVLIFLAPFALVIIGVIKFKDKIIGFFKAVVDWIRDNWKKLLVAFLLLPFLPGGLLLAGILKFKDKIIEAFKTAVNLIVKAFKALPGLLMDIFRKIPGLLGDALKGLGDVVSGALKKIPLVGRLFGGPSNEERYRKVLAAPELKEIRPKIQQLRSEGMSNEDILKTLINSGDIDEDLAKKLIEKNFFAAGGTVPGSEGKAVPIVAHAGEWVLNKSQQAKLGQAMGMGLEQLQMMLFGTNMGQGKPGPKTTKTKPTNKEKGFRGAHFNLVPQEDPNGVVVWFIEMDDGAFGQVSPRDARRIRSSNGNWIPGYVKRSSHGFTQKFLDPQIGRGLAKGGVVQSFLRGGVVSNNYGLAGLQSFADGGTVLQSIGGVPARSGEKSITQNFDVTTNHESDWNYVMRLSAIHAQESL